MPMTTAYAESLAKSIASAVHGTYISGKVTKIGNHDFIEVRYIGNTDSEISADMQTNVVYYTTVSNGVVYTMTSTTFGKVPVKVITDMNYMMKTLTIR